MQPGKPFFKGGFMKKIFKIIISISICITVVLCGCVSAFAVTDNIYSLPTSKPSLTNSGGFIEVLFKSANGNYYVNVFGWNVYCENSTTKTFVDIYLDNNNRLTFNILEYGTTHPVGAVALYHIASTRTLYYYEDISANHYFTMLDTIVNFHVHGNYGEINIPTSEPTNNFAVEYTNESPILVRLDKIYEVLGGGSTTQPPINNDTLIDYENQEQAIIQGSQQGIADGKVILNDIDNVASNSNVLSGLSVMSNLVNTALNYDTNIYSLVRVGLSLGFFAFVVGMSVSLITSYRKGKDKK